MLEPGDPIPRASVWTGSARIPSISARRSRATGVALLCFYVFDWSPG
jgi:hypothetical protein